MANELGTYTIPVILSFRDVQATANRELSGTLGTAGRQAGQDFGRQMGQGVGQGVTASAGDVEKALEKYRKAYDKVADSAGKVRIAEAKLDELRRKGASQDRIIAAEEGLERARRGEVSATRAAQDAYKDYERAQRGAADSMDDMGRRSRGLSGSLGGITDKMKDLGTKAGPYLAGAAVAIGGLVVAGAAIYKVTEALYDMGAQFDEAFDTLAIKTGAGGESLAELQGTLRNLGQDVPLTLGELGDVVAETNRNLHLTGPELDAVSTSLANLGRMTGEAVDYRTLGKAFRAFGVDAADMVPTLNQLYTISTQTGLGVNDILAAATKGTSAIKEFGFSFSEAAGLVALFEDAGLDSEKTMTGLQKAFKLFVKDGKEPKQALEDTVTAIQELVAAGDDLGGEQLANEVFGGKVGKDFFDMIKSGQLDLANLSTSLSGVTLDINEVAANTDDWEQRWQQLKNTAMLALEPLAVGVFDGVNEKLTEFADWASHNQAKIITFFTDLASATITGADAFLGFFTATLQGASYYQDAMSHTLGYVVEGFSKVAQMIGGIIKQIPGFEDLGSKLETAGTFVDDSIDQWQAFGTTIRQDVIPQIDGLRETMRSGRDWINEFGVEAGDAATLAETFGDTIVGLPDGHTITFDSNSPQLEADLAELGLAVTQLPDGRFTVTANTDEGQRIIDNFVTQTSTKPLVMNLGVVGPDGQPLSANQFQQARTGQVVTVPQTNPANVLPPRQFGGVYSYAFGKMPTQAIIQPATKGLVQWAEPSTQGEAFIPLGGGQRSLDIWAETGRRLGVFGASYAAGGLGDAGGLLPFTSKVRALLQQTFPAITDIGGYRSPDGFNEHSSGRALDAMIPDWQSPAGIALGDQVAAWALSIPGVNRVMWQASTIHPDGTRTPVPDRGSPTQNHMDHVHIFTDAQPADAVPVASFQNLGTSTNYATGTGGTAGIGPNGEAGTYTVDQGTVSDAEGQVAEADAKVREAEAKQRELEADAKESEVIAAQNEVDAAKRAAADARADLDEAKKGEFTAGEETDSAADSDEKKEGGLKQFGDVGSLLGGALKETFGIDGSFLPDFSNLMPVQMANSLLTAFKGPLQGAVDGKLGIQQPGWQPGMPVNGVENDTGIGENVTAPDDTSASPFGMPDVDAPPPPGGTPHGTTNGAAPGPVMNVDQSVNYNQPVGWDPVAVQKDITRTQGRRALPRLTGPQMGFK